MFLVKPNRRPMPPKQSLLFPPRYPTRRRGDVKENVLAMFQDADGILDIERVQTTVKKVSDIYNQVSPIFSRIKNR